VKVYDEAALKKMGAGGLLGISQGSDHPPVLVHMRYLPAGRQGAPRGAKKRISLVGKAITFDSGGLSIKPAEAMYTMKCDMAGAAAVLGTFEVMSKLRPHVAVDGIFGACENLPSGKAIRPGDVVKTLNGKTIEVLHTDAEGRVTLADTLAYAVRLKPDAIIDLATLTGACMVALGEEISGAMSNNPKLVGKVLDAARTAGEKMWELPLEKAYKREIKSEVADYKNIAGKYGGALTAGLLLQEFVDEVPWVSYYKDSYALHGAWWHDEFGRPKSHGCVNLAPADARWLFSWMDPAMPEGWYAVTSYYPHVQGTAVDLRP
jgi:leucyl aminopeptidase